MEVFRQTVAGNVLVGSYCALSNNGGLVSVGLSNSVFLLYPLYKSVKRGNRGFNNFSISGCG